MLHTSEKKALLIELGTEELPPQTLNALEKNFKELLIGFLKEAGFLDLEIESFSTPRRLAALVKAIAYQQSDRVLIRKGPALNQAYTADQKPSPALQGFLKSSQATEQDIRLEEGPKGTWITVEQKIQGKSLEALLPDCLEQIIKQLPAARKMRWGANDFSFIRPIQWVCCVWGKKVVNFKFLDLMTGNVSHGHRFLGKKEVCIDSAENYAKVLEENAHVLANFDLRKTKILSGLEKIAEEKAAQIISTEALLNEVVGLTEWPVILSAKFQAKFLNLPQEVLISCMHTHQRVFPLQSKSTQKLLPEFLIVSNQAAKDPAFIIQGNERVIAARLEDALFHYEHDLKKDFFQYREMLKKVLFQAELGSIYDKTLRIQKTMAFYSPSFGIEESMVDIAASSCKNDLLSNMVGEFPELQGMMGAYYIKKDLESSDSRGHPETTHDAIARAIYEHYLPKQAQDKLPQTPLGSLLSLVDKLDSIVGFFGINRQPTGDKDPFGLRRATLGCIRILMEQRLEIDLKALITKSCEQYEIIFKNKNVVEEVLNFFYERMKYWFLEAGYDIHCIEAVLSTQPKTCYLAYEKIVILSEFLKDRKIENLLAVFKRVNNILKQAEKDLSGISKKSQSELNFSNSIERNLLNILEILEKYKGKERLEQAKLLEEPLGIFFKDLMVFSEKTDEKETRLWLLNKTMDLFKEFADFSKL
ncbi:MAG: glycine--tRNA ligase subunit beta [Gammaproteobacteria bacterium]